MVEALFGSKTRVKLLRLFLNNPEKPFYVREITRRIDEQINSVRRELANMLNIGIFVTSENSANNRLYYEVNQQYQYYGPLHEIFADSNTDATSAEQNNDWAKQLKSLGDVKLALLTGAMVAGSKSDIDILLVGTINKTQVKKFIKELEEEEGKPLRYAIMNFDDFLYRLSVKDRFVTSIIQGKHTIIADKENLLSTAA